MTPTNPEADERLIVEQSDRDAAADLYVWENGGPSSYSDSMRRGGEDHGHRVLAFARHRMLALTAANARIAEQAEQITVLMDALTEAAAVCAKWSGLSSKVARTLANGGAA